MKAIFLFVVSMVVSVSITGAEAPATPEYFVGKWNVVVNGTPNGDANFIVTLEKSGDSLAGSLLLAPGASESTPISKIDIADSSVTLYFTAQGYDVYLIMNHKDKDNVTGSLMNMFPAEGSRIAGN
jgi:hypothetical protein